jgi:hypothetical protein
MRPEVEVVTIAHSGPRPAAQRSGGLEYGDVDPVLGKERPCRQSSEASTNNYNIHVHYHLHRH